MLFGSRPPVTEAFWEAAAETSLSVSHTHTAMKSCHQHAVFWLVFQRYLCKIHLTLIQTGSWVAQNHKTQTFFFCILGFLTISDTFFLVWRKCSSCYEDSAINLKYLVSRRHHCVFLHLYLLCFILPPKPFCTIWKRHRTPGGIRKLENIFLETCIFAYIS